MIIIILVTLWIRLFVQFVWMKMIEVRPPVFSLRPDPRVEVRPFYGVITCDDQWLRDVAASSCSNFLALRQANGFVGSKLMTIRGNLGTSIKLNQNRVGIRNQPQIGSQPFNWWEKNRFVSNWEPHSIPRLFSRYHILPPIYGKIATQPTNIIIEYSYGKQGETLPFANHVQSGSQVLWVWKNKKANSR